jgi:hypothetical protein
MPYLDWKALTPEQLRQEVGPIGASSQEDPRTAEHMRMTLSAAPDQLAELARLLGESLDPEARGELRLELPRGWLVFWKKREGESRLLMAHPQQDEWVATVALAAAPATGLVEQVQRLASSGDAPSLSLSSLPAPDGWGSVSNLELVLARL